jgi:hypothetical protein
MLSIGLFDQFGKGPSAAFKARWVWNLFGYCYHSVNVISFPRSQSDYIKRLPLYFKFKFDKMLTTNYLHLQSDKIFWNSFSVQPISHLHNRDPRSFSIRNFWVRTIRNFWVRIRTKEFSAVLGNRNHKSRNKDPSCWTPTRCIRLHFYLEK